MDVRFDSAELEGSKFLGAGEYICTISKVDHKQSKKGEAMIEVEFTAANGKTTRDWFMLVGNKFKLGSLALATGVSKEALLSGGFKTETLPNKKVKVVRDIKGKEVYEGKERNVYENSYLPTGMASGAASVDEEIPF